MDTRPVRSTADLMAALDERRVGDKVCIRRGGGGGGDGATIGGTGGTSV